MEEKKCFVCWGKKNPTLLTKCTFAHLRALLIPHAANCQEELLEDSASTQNSRRPAEEEAKCENREKIVNIKINDPSIQSAGEKQIARGR